MTSTSAAPATREAALVAKDLAYSYGDRAALAGVSFEVQRGSVHAFLGPNGSGKSTLFKVLATILPPQRGSATVLGSDLARDYAEVRRKIGVVFQSPALDRKVTVRRNLEYGGHLYGLRGATLKTRVDEMLAHTGLTDRAGDKVEALSGGLKRRVELAKGLLSRPALLLLDEPTTGLDPGARKDLWQFLEAQEDLTVLVTTHLMDEAALCDRITILHQGAIVAEGTPEELEQSIGSEVLQLTSDAPEELRDALRAEFGIEAQVVERTLRVPAEAPHRLVGDIVDRLGDRIERVTLSRPSLEDVYIQKTGHRFWAEER